MAEQHKHPQSENVAWGTKLETGAPLEATDLYANIDGDWVPLGPHMTGRSKPDWPLVVRPEARG